MILLDTSAVYAWSDPRDPNHAAAVQFLRCILDSGEPVLIHSYVVAEATALLQTRLGLAAAMAFLNDLARLQVHWIGPEDHREAVELLQARSRRQLSLVDCASFVVMRRLGMTQAFAFDSDFEREGFSLFPGSSTG